MDFSQFFSDCLATVIGAGLALWGAIWLDRKTTRRSELTRLREKRERANRVLSLISNELEFNLSALMYIDDNVPSTYRQVRTESWQALSDGGELKPIDDPDLLAIISTAYADIRHFGALYDKFFDMTFFPEKNAYTTLKDVFRNHTMGAKEKAKDSVVVAVKAVKEKLPNNALEATA
jgi:hypothetical protein